MYNHVENIDNILMLQLIKGCEESKIQIYNLFISLVYRLPIGFFVSTK